MFQECDTQWRVADVTVEPGCVSGSPDHSPALLPATYLPSLQGPGAAPTVAALPCRSAMSYD